MTSLNANTETHSIWGVSSIPTISELLQIILRQVDRRCSSFILNDCSLVPRPSTPNTVEGLVKLLRRMTSGGCLEAWHFRWTAVLCMHDVISHASRRPPDVILRMSFTRPSTALGDRRPGNEVRNCTDCTPLASFPGLPHDLEWD